MGWHFEIRVLSPILNLGCRYFCTGLLYRRDKKSAFLTFFDIKSVDHFFSGFRGSDEMTQIVNVFVATVFHVALQFFFRGSYCMFSECSHFVFPGIVYLLFISFTMFVKLSRKFWSLVNPNFFESKKHQPILWNLLFPIFLQLRFCQTGLDELVDILHRSPLWLVYQRVPCPYTKTHFWIWQMPSFSWISVWQV